jgi:hypothetical protein
MISSFHILPNLSLSLSTKSELKKHQANEEATFFRHQYNETNVMHFSLNLLRIKGLYMFRALLAHPQEALNKHHLVYCVPVPRFQCFTAIVTQPTDTIRTQYTK